MATQSQTLSSQSRSAATDVLRAQIHDVRVLSALLRPIAFAAVANFSVSEAGIQVTTESDRSVQAVAYVSASIFSQFDFKPPDSPQQHQDGTSSASRLDTPEPCLDFDLRLQTLLECLNVFGSAAPGGSSSFAGKRENRDGTGGKDPGGGRPFETRPPQSTAPPAKGIHPSKDDGNSRTTGMRLRWHGVGYPLILLLEEQDVTTRCELSTFEPGYGLGLSYHHEDTQAQAILASEYLLDALQSFDAASCSKVTLLFSNSYLPSRDIAGGGRDAKRLKRADASQVSTTFGDGEDSSSSFPVGQPMLKIISDGDFGTAETEFPYKPTSGGTSVLEKFSCLHPLPSSPASRNRTDNSTSNYRNALVHSYRHSHFARLLRALQSSLRTSIRISDRGLLSVQLMMPKGTGGEAAGPGPGEGAGAASAPKATTAAAAPGQGHGFLEFLIAPLDEELDSELVGEGFGGTSRWHGRAGAPASDSEGDSSSEDGIADETTAAGTTSRSRDVDFSDSD